MEREPTHIPTETSIRVPTRSGFFKQKSIDALLLSLIVCRMIWRVGMGHLRGQTDTNTQEPSLTDSRQVTGSIITRMGTATRGCSRGVSSTVRGNTG